MASYAHMLPFKVCVVDNSIPPTGADPTARLDESDLLRVTEIPWEDDDIRNLVKTLLDDRSKWSVSAFTRPEFYLKELGRKSFWPDITIYDWDYGGGSADSAELLRQVLKCTYGVVFIYYGPGHENEIHAALEGTDLAPFRAARLDELEKSAKDSPAKLLGAAEKLCKKSFSFRFGRALQRNVTAAVADLLVELGQHDISFIKALWADDKRGEAHLKTEFATRIARCIIDDDALIAALLEDKLTARNAQDFLPVVESRIRDALSSMEIDGFSLPSQKGTIDPPADTARKVWSFRLYHSARDEIVRRGDIVRTDTRNYYLVLTPDCNLFRFWHKNLGFINLVPLLGAERCRMCLRVLLSLDVEATKAKTRIKGIELTSLSNGMGRQFVEGPFVCPFVRDGDKYLYLVGLPRQIMSIQLRVPDDADVAGAGGALTYKHWRGATPLATIAEPFLTPLMQHCLTSIYGYGAPDYPDSMKKWMASELQEVLLKG